MDAGFGNLITVIEGVSEISIRVAALREIPFLQSSQDPARLLQLEAFPGCLSG